MEDKRSHFEKPMGNFLERDLLIKNTTYQFLNNSVSVMLFHMTMNAPKTHKLAK